MRRNFKGQEAIEFILICVLVFFGGLFAIMTFGSKMAAFFQTDSSFAQVASQKANVISANTTPDFKTNLTTTVEDENRTTIAGYEAMKNPDGSMTINYGTQTVNLTSDDLKLTDTVFETSGSDGIELINVIAKMISENGNTEGTDIPLEISFGQGTRTADENTATAATYSGIASVNTIAVKSGNKLLIVQKDQSCNGTCAAKGIYTIDTTIGSDKTFTSTSVTSVINGVTRTGSYSGTVNNSQGIALNGYFTLDNEACYYWDINFNELKQL